MATLVLTKTFVNLLSTGVAVSGQSARGRGEDYQVPGETRTYAGGRRRSITSAGELGVYTFSLLLVPRATIETLRAWQGFTVQVRDHKGRRFFGAYYHLAITEIVSRTTWNVDISLSVVSVAEGT